MRHLLIAFLALSLCSVSCSKSDKIVENPQWTNKIAALYAHNLQKLTIKEGIYGTLTLLEGNCMPVIDSATTTCKERPIQRNLYVYAYTTADQTLGSGTTTYNEIKSQLKAIIKTDNEGFFELQIEPGTYSIFIEDQGALYANGFDNYGGINPVTVTVGAATESHQRVVHAVF